MNTQERFSKRLIPAWIRRTGTFAVPLIAGALLGACSNTREYVLRSERDPGADIKIVAKPSKEQALTALEIKGVNVTPPDRIVSDATSYVVWVRRDSGAEWRRVGQLEYDPSDREAVLMTTAPELDFELLISAEKAVQPAAPSSETVFSQFIKGSASS